MQRPKTARAVHANRGVRAKYRARLERLIAEMHGSVQYWLTAAYRKFPPRVADIATDAAPSDRVNRILEELAKRWQERFDESAPKIAEAFAKGMFKTTDNGFQAALKDAGWTVKLRLTPVVRDAYQATLQENIALIRSIPQQYLQQVQGIAMRSYTAGRDLGTMVKELQELYPDVADRAILISRDQANKANAVVSRTRSLELGITEGIWQHSSAGKVPRPGHLKAGQENRRYKLAEGCYIDGERIWPGEKINCRCTFKAVLPI